MTSIIKLTVQHLKWKCKNSVGFSYSSLLMTPFFLISKDRLYIKKLHNVKYWKSFFLLLGR